MSFETTSPNMLLPIPGVSLTDGPQWASDLDACLTLVDQHNHSADSGVQITPNGLNINSDLTITNNNLTFVRSLRLSPQGTPLNGVADLGCVYESGVDLWYNDGSGNQIQITQGGGIAGSPGSISNLTSPASASYVALSGAFVWQQAANTSADMDFGSAIMRNDTANSKALTLAPPAAMGADYGLVLPSIPASTAPLFLDTGGNITAQVAYASSFVPTGSSLRFWGTSAPPGFLMEDGSAVSRTTYANLFSVIGTACGSGDGSTTFNVPDSRGRFPRGVDGAAGRDPDSAGRTAMNSGGNTGNNVGSVQSYQIQSHNHFVAATGFTGQVTAGSFSVIQSTETLKASGLIGAEGGNETRPINYYVNYMIKT